MEQEKTYLCRCFYCKAHINILLKVWFYCSVKRPLTTQFNSKVALLICHWKLQFYSLSFHLNSWLHGKKSYFPSWDSTFSVAASPIGWKCCLSTRTWISHCFFHCSWFSSFPFYREDFSIPQTLLRVSASPWESPSAWNWTAAGKPHCAFVTKDWCWEWTSLSILDEFSLHSKELRNLRSLMSQNNSLAQVLHISPLIY